MIAPEGSRLEKRLDAATRYIPISKPTRTVLIRDSWISLGCSDIVLLSFIKDQMVGLDEYINYHTERFSLHTCQEGFVHSIRIAFPVLGTI
jgi:hypothetical protein